MCLPGRLTTTVAVLIKKRGIGNDGIVGSRAVRIPRPVVGIEPKTPTFQIDHPYRGKGWHHAVAFRGTIGALPAMPSVDHTDLAWFASGERTGFNGRLRPSILN